MEKNAEHGKRLTEVEVTASGGSLRLQPPALQADIAARLKKR
jgi:hypothetical protein